MHSYRFHGFARFLLCELFSAVRVLEFTAFPGSPVDAFSTSPTGTSSVLRGSSRKLGLRELGR
jgi:hypothetical protein